ncbi:hypothetical protein EES44_21815 [Streptomyces sp. ADI96-15]|nr:hypothetical protein EES44_21815 [Streptomyces sp. ADI96-15]
MRELRLQLAQLVEVAVQRLVRAVRDAVHGLVGGEDLAVRRLGVTGDALAVLDIPEGVVDVRDPLGRAGGHQVLDLVVLVVDAPLGEVPHGDLRLGRGRRPALGAHLGGAAERAGLLRGVAGADRVGVVGAGRQVVVGEGAAGDGGDPGAVALHLVALDALVVGGRRPGERGGVPGDLGDHRGAGGGGRGVLGLLGALAGDAVELAAGGGAVAGAVETEGGGGAGGEGAVPGAVLGGPAVPVVADLRLPGEGHLGAGGELPLQRPVAERRVTGVLHRPPGLEAGAPVLGPGVRGAGRVGGLAGGGEADHPGEGDREAGEGGEGAPAEPSQGSKAAFGAVVRGVGRSQGVLLKGVRACGGVGSPSVERSGPVVKGCGSSGSCGSGAGKR